MTTSGTTNFSLTIADAIDEAFERIGVAVASIDAAKMISARRSLDLLFIEWGNRLPFQCKTEQEVIDLSASDPDVTLDDDIIEVIMAFARKDGKDYLMNPISRTDYQMVNDKTISSDWPTTYFLDKQRDSKVLYLYPVAVDATVDIHLTVLREIQDTGAIRYTPDVAKHFYNALCSGLTWFLSEKYAPEQYDKKATIAEVALRTALSRDVGRADIILRPKMGRGRL